MKKLAIVSALFLVIAFIIPTPPLPKEVKEVVKIQIKIPTIKARTKATMEEKKANRKMAQEFAWAGYGWRGQHWTCIDKLFTAESRFDHLADNPKSTAYGIGQVLSEKSSDPAIQILRAYQYIEHRYNGSPCKAWVFHLKTGHY
jgi:hypothetical protein